MRKNPAPIRSDIIAIPKALKDKHQKLQLFMDTMYINGEAFMTTITHPIYYRTSTHMAREDADMHYETLDHTLRVYNKNGF